MLLLNDEANGEPAGGSHPASQVVVSSLQPSIPCPSPPNVRQNLSTVLLGIILFISSHILLIPHPSHSLVIEPSFHPPTAHIHW